MRAIAPREEVFTVFFHEFVRINTAKVSNCPVDDECVAIIPGDIVIVGIVTACL